MPPLQTRSKTGCFTCRQRHKKCDEVQPICSGCVRNRLLCCWPPEPGGRSLPRSREDSRSLSVVILPPGMPIGHSPTEMPPVFLGERSCKLLARFVTATSRHLSNRNQPINPLLIYNLQMAWHNVNLQRMILALSSCELSCLSTLAPSTESMAHYRLALRGLRDDVARWPSASRAERLATLATTLALCQYEVTRI